MPEQYHSPIPPEDGLVRDVVGSHAKLPSKSLYISHFISTWNSRGFEFGAVLFLATIYPGTLLPMSVYALIRALAAIVLSPSIGSFIDTTERLPVIRTSIAGQRVAVAASCLAFLALIQYRATLGSIASTTLFVILIILACVEKLSAIMNTVAVERDWVVVVAGDDELVLQQMNSQMRRIDLFCKLVSPLGIAILDGISSRLAIILTLIINLTSVFLEYFLILWVYKKSPSLANKTGGNTGIGQPEDIAERSSGNSRLSVKTSSASRSVWTMLAGYVGSHAFLPSLALAILYFTVLNFSGQMITYLLSLKSPTLTSTSIGLLRTAATAFEISSTFIAPRLIRRLGAVRSGIWCLSVQCLCLTPAVGTFWMTSSDSSSAILRTSVLIVSVVLSRTALFAFDLIAQLLVQNSIVASQRGTFSAVEASLQNFFELCAFATTIVWSRPAQFKYPATVSLGAIYLAAALYAKFVRTKRGHLLHLPSDCCGGKKVDDVVQGEYELVPTVMTEAEA